MEQEPVSNKKGIIASFLKQNILLSPDIVPGMTDQDAAAIHSFIPKKIKSGDFLFLNQDLKGIIFKKEQIDANLTNF